jgi:integrase
MLDWLTKQVPKLNISAGTRRRYDVLLRRLEQFDKLKSWDDLTVENLYEFDAWLHQITKAQSNGERQAKDEPQKIGDSAVYNYHRTLKSLLNRAVKMNIIANNPYERLKGEFPRGVKESVEYLTEEEIAAVESLHPMKGTQVAMARDLFVFQLYTGLSYSDAQAFDIAEYKKINGRWINTGERIKTGVPYVSQLLPQAVEVLERYNWQVPQINNMQYNASLKDIQKALGIRTRLHSHLARHTFATRMLAMGVKIENVSRMLGHSNITMTQRYAKVLAESVHEDFDMIAKKLTQK